MNDSMAEIQTQMMLAHGAMFGLGLVMQIAFAIVALTAVRRASRDASNLMLLGLGLHVLGMIASPVVTALGARDGVEASLRTMTISTVAFGLLGLVATSLQLVAIVRLAEAKHGRGDDAPRSGD